MSEKFSRKEKDTESKRRSFRAIARSRIRLVVCFWTLPLYTVAVWILLNNEQDINLIMWVYMAIYAIFAIDMSMRRCPSCHQQFYVKSIFLNLLTTKCVHCKQPSSVKLSEED
jgi:hypothetical protein